MQTIEQWEAEAMRLAEEYGGERWHEGISDGDFDKLGARSYQAQAAETLAALSAHLATHPGRQGEDSARIDWLEAQANERGGILLHDGSEKGRRGLGLRPGALSRTLREAIDAAMPKEPTHD